MVQNEKRREKKAERVGTAAGLDDGDKTRILRRMRRRVKGAYGRWREEARNEARRKKAVKRV